MPDSRQKNTGMLLGFLGPVGLFLALAGLIVLTLKDSPDIRIAMYITIAIGLIITLLGAGNFIYYFIRATQGVRLYSSMMVIGMVLAATAVVVMANYVATRHSVQWDLTSTSMYSISNLTIEKLKSLDKDIKLTYIYYAKEEDYSYVSKIVDSYRNYTNRVQVEYFNPDRDRDVVYHYEEKFNLEQGDKLVVQLGTRNAEGEMVWERNQVIMVADMFEGGSGAGGSRMFVGEQKITEAIVKITSDHLIKVGFSINHLECDIEDRDKTGFGDLKYELEREGKSCETVDLSMPVANDINLLVIGGPGVAFKLEEFKNLDDFVQRGGSVFVLARGRSGNSLYKDSPLEPWLAKYGIVIKPGFVHDSGIRLVRGLVLFNKFGKSDMTKMFKEDRFVAAQTPRAIENTEEKPEGIEYQDLLTTSDYGELYPQPEEDSSIKEEGMFSIAKSLLVAPKGDNQGFRMVVVGDFAIATNAFLKNYGLNKDFVMNCVNWLAEEETLIEIRPKSPTEAHFTFTEKRLTVVGYFVLLCLPLLCLYAGICVWLLRRK